jgi:SAM-dependent methyltransferase
LSENSHKIEILTESLIDEHPELAMEVLATSSRLAVPLGWHYLLDLIWLLDELEPKSPQHLEPPFRILDVGAGMGLMQFMLADRGYEVISLDMRDRNPAARFRDCYEFRQFAQDAPIDHSYLDHLGDRASKGHGLIDRVLDLNLRTFLRRLKGAHTPRPSSEAGVERPARPVVHHYRCDARNMTALEDGAIDAVVSVSALEHNDPQLTEEIQREIERVVRPGGVCLHTTSAIQKGRSFHEPSHSHLMDDAELAKVFGLESYESNWQDWERLDAEMRSGGRLSRWLAHTYYARGTQGMPWGIWDPAYLPVGVRKVL